MQTLNDKLTEPTPVGSFDIFHERAMSALSVRNYQAAEVAALQAQSIQPNHAGVFNLLGQIWLAQQRNEEAADAFAAAVERNPALPNLRFNLALAYQAQGRLDAAIEQVASAVRLDPGTAVLHAKLGQLLLISGSAAEAVTVLRHAVELDPRPMAPRLNLAQALIDEGEFSESESLIRQLLRESPRDPNTLRLDGVLNQVRGDFAKASGRFQEAIALRPVESANYLSLTQCKKMSSGDASLVDQMMRLCVQPGLPHRDKIQLSYAIAKSLDDSGDHEGACRWYQKANEMALSSMTAAGRRYDAAEARERTSERIQLFTKEYFSALPSVTIESKRPIFIVGMIRSGSTLVEQILSRHPDVSAGGEIAYWAGSEAAHTERIQAGPLAPEAVATWRQEYDAISVRAKSHKGWVTDKMPLNYRALGTILTAYPDAKIVHCRRNPRDTCLSIYLTPYRSAPEFAHDLGHIADAYQDYTRLMDHWRQVLPADQMIEVEYEALVGSPEGQIRELIGKCGLPWSDSCLDSTKGAVGVQTPSIWQVRQPIHQGSVGRWKRYEQWLNLSL